VFRDTRNWYLEKSNYASPALIEFAAQFAGKKILDVGCATGEYCIRLNELGFKCVGIDANPEYIVKAKRGVEAHVMNAESLVFADNSFDSILLFEILEHMNNLNNILKEAKRVAGKNILVTVPNCTDFFQLRKIGLTYEHMLESDHVNFFTKQDLEKLLSKHFKRFRVEEKEPINSIVSPSWLRKVISLFYRLKLLEAGLYYRLYAIVDLEEGNE